MSDAEVGTVRAKFIADFDEWLVGLDKVETSLAETKVKSEEYLGSMRDSSAQVGEAFFKESEAAEKWGMKLVNTWDQLTGKQPTLVAKLKDGFAAIGRAQDQINNRTALGMFSQGLNKMNSDLLAARDRTRAVMAEMRGAFGDEAAKMTKIAEEQLKIGISPEKATSAMIILKRFHLDAATELKGVEDAAAATGRNMDSVAQKIGRAFEFKDTKSFTALQKELGITSDRLRELGVRFDDHNHIMADTPARAAKVEQAYRQIMATDFAGAADRMASSSKKLSGEMELLKREVAQGAEGFNEQMAPSLLKVVQYVRTFSPATKEAIGATIQFGAAMTQGAVAVIATASQVSILATTLKGTTVATWAMTAATSALNVASGILMATVGTGVAIFAAVAAAVGVAAYAYTSWRNAVWDAELAQEKLDETNRKLAAGLKGNIDVIGKNADELRRMGKTATDVTKAILGLQLQIEQAKEKGASPAELKRLQQELAQAQGARGDLATGEDQKRQAQEKADLDAMSSAEKKKADKEARAQAKRDAAEAKKEQEKAFDQALADINQQASAKKISHTEEIDRLKDLQRQTATAAQERRVANELARLEGQDKAKADKEAAAARKLAVQADLTDIKKLAATRAIDHAEEISRLQQLISTHQLVGRERMQIEMEIARLKGQMEREHTKTVKEEEAKRKKEVETSRKEQIKDAVAALKEQAAIGTISRAEEIDGLKKVMTQFKLNADEKRRILLEIAGLEAKIRSGELSAEKKDDHAAEKDKETLRTIQKGTSQADIKTADEQIKALEEAHERLGQNTLSQIKTLLEARLALEIKEIEAEKKAVQEKTKNSEIIAAAEVEAQAKIREARAKTTAELQKEVDKQNAIKAKQKAQDNQDLNLGGGTYSLADLGKQMATTFGADAVRAQIAANQAVTATDNSFQGSQPAFSATASKPVNAVQANGSLGKVEKAVKDLAGQMMNITIQVNVPGQDPQTQTFSGTMADLEKAKNVFNPKSILGRS